MKKIPFLILAAMLAVSCQKENSSPAQSSGTHLTGLSSQQSATSQHPADSTAQLDGTYAGNFNFAATGQIAQLPVQFKVAGNQFNSVVADNDYSVGDGTISSVNATLTFTNIDAFPGYIKAGSIIPLSCVALSGTYAFKVKSDSLFLTRLSQGATYSYALKKQ
jgi:hypothetical protein